MISSLATFIACFTQPQNYHVPLRRGWFNTGLSHFLISHFFIILTDGENFVTVPRRGGNRLPISSALISKWSVPHTSRSTTFTIYSGKWASGSYFCPIFCLPETKFGIYIIMQTCLYCNPDFPKKSLQDTPRNLSVP